MFRHPAWAVGNYSTDPPAAGTVSMGGFHQQNVSPCREECYVDRFPTLVDEYGVLIEEMTSVKSETRAFLNVGPYDLDWRGRLCLL